MSAVLKPQPTVLPFEDWMTDQVIALAREMHAESVTHRDIPLDEAKLLRQLHAAHTMPDTVYFKLCIRGDEVLGGFFGTIVSTYFSEEKCAKDLAWFVSRTRRGSMAACLLVADFETWGKAHGVNTFMLSQSTGVSMDTTQALYEHLGYQVVGVNTVKRI